MNTLDDLEAVRKIDRGNMLEIYRNTPELYIDSLNRLKSLGEVLKKSPDKRIRNVVILGMGGSALNGEILRDWSLDFSKVPIELCRDYHLPNYVNEETLVIAVSYSGNTEETASSFVEALERKCPIVVISSGGVLEEFCNLTGTPLIKVPKGSPPFQPRCATPYLLSSMAAILNKFGIIPFNTNEFEETVEVLKKVWNKTRPECPIIDNPAKKMALDIFGSTPVIYGFRQYKSIALATKIAFNENSKIPSKYEFFPELNHNEIVGFERYKKSMGRITTILIRDSAEPPEIKVAIEAAKTLISSRQAGKILEIYGEGTSRLAKMLCVKYITDMASVYLAVLNNVDPTYTQSIDVIKHEAKAKLNLIEDLRKRIKGFTERQ